MANYVPESLQKLFQESANHHMICPICYNDYMYDMGDWIDRKFIGDCGQYDEIQKKIREWKPSDGERWPEVNEPL